MQTSARRLSDEQLATAQLEVPDPCTLPDLSRERPNADLTPEIIGEYHLANDVEPIWCCHCQASRHRNGFVITNGTGKHFLLGSTCGPEHYGLSFAFARRQHSDLAKRKGVLARLNAILATAHDLKRACHSILHSEGLRAVDAKRAELRRASEQVASLLATAVQNGSALDEMVKVRDFEAERRRDERSSSGKQDGPIYTQERRSLGSVAGSGLVRTKGDCRDCLIALRDAVDHLFAFRATDTNKHALQTLTKAVRAAEEAWARAESAVTEAEAAPFFFSADNLSRLSRWSVAHKTFDLIADEGRLVVIDRQGRRTTIGPLGLISLPPFPRLAAANDHKP